MSEKIQKIINDNLDKCTECPHEDYDINWRDDNAGTGKFGAYIYPDSDMSVLVIGQNPSHKRWRGTHSMEGRQGELFRKIFGKSKLVFSNFIPVSTPNNKIDQLSNQEIAHCIEHLTFQIDLIKPKLIIVCSSFAKKKLKELGYDLGFTGAKLFFVNHPDYYYTYHKGDLNEYHKQITNIRYAVFGF